jgi:hypothetical protein
VRIAATLFANSHGSGGELGHGGDREINLL